VSEEKTYTEQEAHRHFAAQLNGEVWRLLEKSDRTPTENEQMIHTAHASLCHWLKVGIGVHHQRGTWMLARVYSEVGIAEAALRYAQRCHELTEEHAELMEDFDRAYTLESLARANALAGNREKALEYFKKAEEAGQAIADKESQNFFEGDLNGGNWHGLR
jgi:tetratricopeptide (TPR) repeat protein